MVGDLLVAPALQPTMNGSFVPMYYFAEFGATGKALKALRFEELGVWLRVQGMCFRTPGPDLLLWLLQGLPLTTNHLRLRRLRV